MFKTLIDVGEHDEIEVEEKFVHVRKNNSLYDRPSLNQLTKR